MRWALRQLISTFGVNSLLGKKCWMLLSRRHTKRDTSAKTFVVQDSTLTSIHTQEPVPISVARRQDSLNLLKANVGNLETNLRFLLLRVCLGSQPSYRMLRPCATYLSSLATALNGTPRWDRRMPIRELIRRHPILTRARSFIASVVMLTNRVFMNLISA